MKKWYIIAILLLFPLYIQADGPFDIATPAEIIGVADPDEMIGVTGLAASCSTPTGTDLSEGFEDAGDGFDDANWTQAESGSAQVSAAGTPPSGVCSYSRELRSTYNGSATYERDYWDNGSTIDYSTYDITVTAEIYLDDVDLDGYDYVYIMAFCNNTNAMGTCNDTFKLYIVDEDADNTDYTIGISGSDSCEILDDQIALDTWYKVTVTIDTTTTGALSELDVGGTTCNFNRRDISQPRYLNIGQSAGLDDAGDVAEIEYGYITVDVTTP